MRNAPAWGCPELRSSTACTIEFAHFRHISRSQAEQDIKLFRQLYCDDCQKQRNYVEIGALDGQRLSNTLMFESHFNWGGLLIEGHPENAVKLVKRRAPSGRNTIFSEAVCDVKGNVTFIGDVGDGTAGLPNQMSESYKAVWSKRGRLQHKHTVPCRPIGEMIRLAKLEEIHFFSLDVEGAELLVLSTMDWSVPVHVWMVEMPSDDDQRKEIDCDHVVEQMGDDAIAAGGANSTCKQAQIRALMRKHGYAEMSAKGSLHDTRWAVGNAVFVHGNLVAGYDERSLHCLAPRPPCNRTNSVRSWTSGSAG